MKKGGLGIPDVYTYYLAYNGVYSISWPYKKDEVGVGSWRWLEQKIISESCKNISLASFWYQSESDKHIKNAIILFSCQIVKAIHKQLKFNGLSLPSCPIWKNSLFLAGGKPIHNDTWLDKNVVELGHILNSNEEMFSFHELRRNLV